MVVRLYKCATAPASFISGLSRRTREIRQSYSAMNNKSDVAGVS